ncbi:MAG: FAD-dependent oxidoreductase [candidate division WOR-3 bacterium]
MNVYETIVVGGGVAGLTSAAYLARAGQKVLLIEKNNECGGLVSSFNKDGFHFDAGVRALEDAGIIRPMLKELGINLEFVKSPVSVGVEDIILHIENESSIEDYRNMLKKLYPESGEDIDRIIIEIKKIMKDMEVLYGIENPVFKDLKHDLSFVFRKIIPWFPKFLFTIKKINRMNMPVEIYLKNITKNQSLIDIIAQHFFKNTPAFFALSYFSLYLDYIYPKGGVGKLSEAIKKKIVEYGGQIKTETKIVDIFADENLLKDHNGNAYKYRNLIWAADLKTLYRNVKIQGLPVEIQTKIKDMKKMILSNRGGDSVFTLFLEVDEPLESFRKIANGHFFYTPSKKGLGKIHRKELDELLANFDKVDRGRVLSWLDKFTQFNTYEISIPGLKDPALVPQGKTGLIISLLVEYDLFKKVHEAGWYEEFKIEIENRILNIISNSVYPMLNGKVISRFSFTPLSIQNRVGSSEGAITGWAFQEEMPVINKIQSSARAVLTPIPSVFQAGQWVYSPAGVPMSILTGKLAANQVLKKKNKA